MATPGKATKKETKRQIPAKTSLDTPFNDRWQPLPHANTCAIQEALRRHLESTGLQKIETNVFRKFKERKNKPPATQECAAPESHDAHVLQSSAKNGWTDRSARRQLAVGINEVTKAMERNELRLALVCKSVKPKHMTDHLIALSASRAVPACQLQRLSDIVSEPLRLKSVLALGVRHCSPPEEDHFAELVRDVIPLVPPLGVAWLQGPVATGGADEELAESDKRGQKRKLEDELELKEFQATSMSRNQCATSSSPMEGASWKRRRCFWSSSVTCRTSCLSIGLRPGVLVLCRK
ncbi:hypothetical protein CRUP_034922 [Coryphaenoides rupestris]|nr:hypothetical protein CRUP_034922 [Coryphaenoides rupestris]